MTATKIAYIQAGWHSDITDGAKEAFLAEIATKGFAAEDVDIFTVPGSLEIPVVSKKLAQTGNYRAVCASGLVVDGGIYRHEFVAQAVINGIVQVSLETGVPVLSAILTPHQFHEHATHFKFFAEHMHTKGKELAQACAHVLETLSAIG